MVKVIVTVALGSILFVFLIAAVLVPGPEGDAPPGYGSSLRPGTVPQQYEKYVTSAAHVCSGVDGPLLAAQLDAESGWDPTALSTAGAEGLAQFMPAAWAEWGNDADGNGVASALDPADAIAAQADYMCHLFNEATRRVKTGEIFGETADLALAAYNAGLGAVESAGGVPTNGETELYVPKVLALRLTYAMPSTGGGTVVEGYETSPTRCPATGEPQEENLQPGALRGARCAMAAFPFVTLNSGWRASGSVSVSDHPFGNAMDFGVTHWASHSGNQQGWFLAHWFQVNAERLNVKYVIWDNWTWNPAKQPNAWIPYYHATGRDDPSARHEDHVHVSFNSPTGDDSAPLIGHAPALGTTPRAEFVEPDSALS